MDAALREPGYPPPPARYPRAPCHRLGSLTTTEITVADLVAEGLSNPQIGERLYVSRRTVQTHLAHIFAKLGISSRVPNSPPG